MNVCSLEFLLSSCILVLLFHAVSGLGSRRLILVAANVSALAAFRPGTESLITLAVFLLATHATLRLAPRIGKVAVAALGMSIVLAFLVVKRYAFLGPLLPAGVLEHPAEVVGLSYMLFRFLHMLVDVREGQIAEVSLLSYLNYQLSFLTVVAGPIQRYPEFLAFWNEPGKRTISTREGLLAWDRLLSGMIKIGLVSTVILYFYDRGAGGMMNPQSSLKLAAHFLVCFYSYPAYLFFNFSGYTDVVLGLGRLLGLTLPENFDRPYLARNILDFWNRWHISLSTWIRDYLFMTSYKWAIGRFGPARFIGPAAVFVSLLVAGLWHGSTWNFAVFGLIHGLGAAVTQIYDGVLKKRLKGPSRSAYGKNPWIHGTACFVTFHVVCFSFLFFAQDLGTTVTWLRALATARWGGTP